MTRSTPHRRLSSLGAGVLALALTSGCGSYADNGQDSADGGAAPTPAALTASTRWDLPSDPSAGRRPADQTPDVPSTYAFTNGL